MEMYIINNHWFPVKNNPNIENSYLVSSLRDFVQNGFIFISTNIKSLTGLSRRDKILVVGK